MAMGDVGVLMRLAPTSAINEIPSTSYVQDRAGALGPRSKRSSLNVGEASVRNSGYGGNAYVWSRGLSGNLHAQEGVGLQIRSPWQSAVGIYRHRRRFQTVSGLKEGEGLCKWGTLGTGAAVFHSIEQSGLYTPINKERNPLLGVLTLIYGDGGSGGGNHGSGGGGGGSGNEEESFQNTNGRQILAGLVSLLSLLFGTRRCLRSWILCLSAASVGFLLSSWSQLGGVALALTATSFSKPRRLADGTSGSENGDEVSGVQSGKDLEGAIWEVKGSKWQRYILDVENDGFVPDVLKQNEVDAEAYELSCQEEKGQELARSEVDREYASVRSRLAEQVKNWESEGIEDSRKTEEIGGVDSLAARNLNLNPQINHGREWAVSQLDEDGARMEQAQPNKEAASTIQIQLQSALDRFGEVMKQVMLPEGYPRSVTDDYTEFTMWRMGQIIASQISGVLTTQALLYAVGLGKGAIPTAAAINWVLRDGIGYLSKIMLSKYGRHFDVHPKGWRVLSDLLENASYGLELLTPVFPHLFVYLGAVAGAGRSAAGMIQAATKSCFNAGFAAQRNFAEVVAKGEAQGMVSKSIGIALGIAVSSYVGSSGPQLLATFAVVTGLHMFFNLKSYQAVQLRTLNTYRASLVLSEYLRSGTVPSVREVNAEEPIVPRIGFFHLRLRGQQEGLNTLSEGSKQAAESIDQHLELGSTFGSVIHTREEADALLPLYEQEQYILAQRGDRLLVVLKESVTPRDMLRALFQVTIMRNLSIMYPNLASYRTMVGDCRKGGILELSYNIMSEEFERMQQNLSMTGWVSEGLVARPSPNRLLDAPKEV